MRAVGKSSGPAPRGSGASILEVPAKRGDVALTVGIWDADTSAVETGAGYRRFGVPMLSLVDDLEAAFRRGDEDALRRAYTAHGSTVYSLCLRRLDRETAGETTQEVFLAAWRSHERFDPAKGSLVAWLVAITKNKIIDALRKRGRRPDAVPMEDPSVMADPDVDEHDDVDRLAERMLLAEAMETLSDRARNVM